MDVFEINEFDIISNLENKSYLCMDCLDFVKVIAYFANNTHSLCRIINDPENSDDKILKSFFPEEFFTYPIIAKEEIPFLSKFNGEDKLLYVINKYKKWDKSSSFFKKLKTNKLLSVINVKNLSIKEFDFVVLHTIDKANLLKDYFDFIDDKKYILLVTEILKDNNCYLIFNKDNKKVYYMNKNINIPDNWMFKSK